MLIGVVVVAVMICVYFLLVILNKNTPLPDGCENLEISSEKCGACNNGACGYKDKFRRDE